MINEDLHENWRALSFRSDAELANVPHQVARRNESAHWELITDNASTTIAYLKGKGIDQIASSRLSLEQIAVQILKGMEKGQGDRP